MELVDVSGETFYVFPPKPPLHPHKAYFLEHGLDFHIVKRNATPLPPPKADNTLSAAIAAATLAAVW